MVIFAYKTCRAVFDYANPTTLKVGATGSGGVKEAVAQKMRSNIRHNPHNS